MPNPTFPHASLTGDKLHEPKGIAAAAAKAIRRANGAGGGSFTNRGYGSIYFTAGGYTLTTPTSFTAIVPTTVAGGIQENYTEGTSGTLTYTGALRLQSLIQWSAVVSHDDASARQIEVAIGNASSEALPGIAATAAQNEKVTLSGIWYNDMQQNEVLQLWGKAAAGDLTVHRLSIVAWGWMASFDFS